MPVPPTGVPAKETDAPSESDTPEALAEPVKKAAEIWRYNRSVYPGWPILPFSKRRHLSACIEAWVNPMLKAIPALSPIERLTVVRELIERIELPIDPLTPELVKAATDALSALAEHLEGNADLSDEQRNEIDDDRSALMLALLTDCRHDLDQAKFDEWGRRLENIVRPRTSAFHRLHHERCLWKLRVQDFAGLRELLSGWRPGHTNPMWTFRKAALLVESGEVDDGRRLALSAIQHAERGWSRDRRVLTASRLGWALHWRHALNLAQWWDGLLQGERSSQPDSDLWARLAPYGGDATSDLDAYVGQMAKQKSEDSPWTFDLKRVHRITLSNPEARWFRSAWRVVRILELSGLPSGIPGVRIASDHLDGAARLVAPFVPAYAARLLLIGGSGNKETLNVVLSQTHVARMSDEDVSSLFDAAERARDYFLKRWTPGSRADFLRQKVENAIGDHVAVRCPSRGGPGTGTLQVGAPLPPLAALGGQPVLVVHHPSLGTELGGHGP